MEKLNRRQFIEMSAMAGGAALMGGCRCPLCGCGERVPYGDTIGDRLWMWGHHRDSFKSLKGKKENYNLPYDTRIDMAAACKDGRRTLAVVNFADTARQLVVDLPLSGGVRYEYVEGACPTDADGMPVPVATGIGGNRHKLTVPAQGLVLLTDMP